jgi:hypothetical protein
MDRICGAGRKLAIPRARSARAAGSLDGARSARAAISLVAPPPAAPCGLAARGCADHLRIAKKTQSNTNGPGGLGRAAARGWMGRWWGALLRAGLDGRMVGCAPTRGVGSALPRGAGGGGRSHGVTHVSPRCLTSSKEPSTQPLTLIPHLSCMSAYPCDCCCVDACIYPPALNPKP